MTQEKTLSIIKPDGFERKLAGAIISRIEQSGLRIVQLRMTQLDEEMASAFYAEHHEKVFFKELVSFMSSGRIIVQVLSGDDAIARYRKLIGVTDSLRAEPGSIRRDFCESEPNRATCRNLVHGSDSAASAKREIDFFFSR